MRKIVLVLFILALSAGSALALDMEAKSFYAQGIFALPTGDWSDAAGNGFGGGIGMLVPHNEQLNFRGEVSFIKFGGKSFGDYDWSYRVIPIVALAEYTFQYDSPLYGLGGLGLYMGHFSADYTGPDGFGFGSYDDNNNDFGLVIGGGYHVNEQICVEGRFNIVSDSNELTIHGVYHF